MNSQRYIKSDDFLDASSPDMWADHGFLVRSDLLSAHVTKNLSDWIDEISAMQEQTGGLEHHWEQTDNGPKLCRSEHVLERHDELRKLLTTGPVQEAASKLLGEQAILYKEKINYKQPGGAGFAAHQDAPAFPFIGKNLTCLIAVDDMTHENGCLEFALGNPDGLLSQNDKGCVADDVVNRMTWQSYEVPRNSCLFFSSFAPHRSSPNISTGARRGIYLTYNGVSDGDRREEYYAQRQLTLARNKLNNNAKISLISDFQGKLIPSPQK